VISEDYSSATIGIIALFEEQVPALRNSAGFVQRA
jgi:hypothetical protein